ncbi:hypothetical protein NQ318_002568 [Aromia moschata]|uniref:SCP domain-containing protein n=1 Tax=Aromia moschata TaxID=1265417 RepID=A0AAV8Y718_9CUCU|nr:hypothetical protein NQ318_002568 [Aromia moschata]
MEYLTRNLSHVWLRNQTENQFSFNPYCSICCMNISDDTVGKRCGKHTMCVYEDRAGSNCKGFISIRFTQDEIAVIVDIHNTLRNKVATGKERRGDPGPQPMASNMRIIEWDPELAIVASRWASQCVFAHDMCRDVSRYPVGQNIAKGNFALNNDLSFIVSWYETVEMFNKAGISRFQLRHHNRYPSPLQYAQLVWAETYQVGCARVAFQRADGPKVTYTEHFVCNYGPSGNIPGQRVYKVGGAVYGLSPRDRVYHRVSGLVRKRSRRLERLKEKREELTNTRRRSVHGHERREFKEVEH